MSRNNDDDDVIAVEDLGKGGPIRTGIGFLDHMIDQLHSHAQIGVRLVIIAPSLADDDYDPNRHAKCQEKVMKRAGMLLGTELQRMMESKSSLPGTIRASARFSCPLDEALVECEICRSMSGSLDFQLAPFGNRTKIGSMETDKLIYFWQALALSAHLDLRLVKIRGSNGHHIIESAFKAFARALRKLLDGNTASNVDNWNATLQLQRQAIVERNTKETSIAASLQLDGAGNVQITTGIQTLDAFLTTLAISSKIMSLNITCKGDLWIDEHHTAEDVAIALGQVLQTALGDKAGLVRMGDATVDGIQVVMDLSNRPCFTYEGSFWNQEMIGDLSSEMFLHVLDSLTINARMTLHIVEKEAAASSAEQAVQGVAKAWGEAFRQCAMVDLRRAGATASSKGTLSV
jgi:imidazoleglycerol-phosphate dehydratase